MNGGRLALGVHAPMRLLFLLTLVLPPLPAQENRFEGRPIASVRVEPEGGYLHPSDLSKALARLREGQPLRAADVRESLTDLYRTGRFENIVVEADDSPQGVAVRFVIEPSAYIRNVTVTGVPEPPSAGQLVNATGLQLGDRLFPTQIRQSVERVLESLRANGFYLAKVFPELTQQPNQQVDIRLAVDTGPRAHYTDPIVRGNALKPVADIVRATRWRKWLGFGPYREATDARTQQGIDRIQRAYQKRDYLMARISLDGMAHRESDNRAVPTLTIESGPRVTVRVEGAKISGGKLRELVPVYQELSVDKDLLVEGKREITEYLQSRGYFEAEADFELKRENDRQVILYSIFEGARHKLVHIGISGNKYFSTDTIRERMYTAQASLLRYRRGRFSQDYLRRDAAAIRALYRTNGFPDTEVVTRVDDDYKGKTNEVAVYFEVREGAQWFVAALEIEGVDDAAKDELFGMMQSLEGQPYSELNVATDQDSVLSLFYNTGYPNARFEPQVIPDKEPNRVRLKYVVTPGDRQFVRDVLISGLRSTDIELVRSRIRDLAPGAPLAQNSVIESQRRLYDLGIFARVDAAIQNNDGDTDNKFILYRFEEASRWSLNTGFGAQIARIGRGRPNLDTPAGAPGFGPRVSFGVSRNNIFGIGHTVTLQTQWAPGLRQRGVVTYLAPQIKGDDNLTLSFTGSLDDSRDVQTFNSKRREVAVQLSRRLSRANTLQTRVAWRRVTLSDIAITPSLVPLFARPVSLATVSGTFIQDRRDDPIEARRGVWNTVDLTFAANTWDSPNTVFTRVLARNATYHPLNREWTIARQLSIGGEFRHTNSDVPFPERFFAGGVASHRGFPDNQAGPRDLLTGFPVGGKALVMHNTELRFPLLGDNVGGVFFHDAGNIYSRLSAVSFRWKQRDLEDFDYMVQAVGFGIRYKTPIGPVRLDLGWSVNSPRFMGVQGNFDDLLNPNANLPIVAQRITRLQFHFSLGQLF